MDTVEFDIDGFIGEWGYSNRYVKACLRDAGDKPVVCRVCSNGGDFLMAMNIKDEFARHGKVTVDISGYAASAATIIGLGAKQTRISNTSFYLIHKVMSWVDAWGNLNEDEIDELITRLEAERDENAKMTLVLAKAYAEKTGKEVKAILALMKQETWLTADEAKEWGFVDEVYNSSAKINLTAISKKFNLLGLPDLPGNVTSNSKSLVSEIVEGIKDFFFSDKEKDLNLLINKKKMDVFGKVNEVLNVSALESADGKGVYLDENQLRLIENALAQRDKRIGELQGHETNYNSAVEKLNNLHPEVKKAETLEAKINVLAEQLAAKPGVSASTAQSQRGDQGDDGVDWAVMNSLEHMQSNPGELI